VASNHIFLYKLLLLDERGKDEWLPTTFFCLDEWL
jgi:hypothetical protein